MTKSATKSDKSEQMSSEESRTHEALFVLGEIVRPPPKRTPDLWADQTRTLPPGSAEPGPYRSDRAPYTIPFQRAAITTSIKRAVAVISSQSSKTESCINICAHTLDDHPSPVLWLTPTRSNAEKVISRRMNACVEQSSGLKLKKRRGHNSTKTLFTFAGDASFRLAWSGSTSELASDSARLCIGDEIDRMANDIGGEGSASELLDARHVTYYDGRSVFVSSPTTGKADRLWDKKTGFDHWVLGDPENDIQSPIWRLWQEPSKHEWAWPCPDCFYYFIPHFGSMQIPKNASPKKAAAVVCIVCPNCGSAITQAKRDWMNARGHYVAPGVRLLPYQEDDKGGYFIDAQNQDVCEATREDERVYFVLYGDCPLAPLNDDLGSMSFWVSGLASTWMTWSDLAAKYVRASRSGLEERVRAVVNTGFAELFTSTGEVPSSDEIENCRGVYRLGELVKEVQRIIVSVDVQKNGLYVLTRGWGKDWESWLLNYEYLDGETNDTPVWEELEEILINRKYGDKPIHLMMVDAGFRRQYVCEFARKHTSRVRACRGRDIMQNIMTTQMEEVTRMGTRKKYGFRITQVNTNYVKTWVYDRIQAAAQEGKSVDWHIPKNATDEYLQQLLSEEKIIRPNGKTLWIRKRRANHALDCEGLQVCGAHMLNVHQLGDIDTEKREEKRKSVKQLLGNSKLVANDDPYL